MSLLDDLATWIGIGASIALIITLLVFLFQLRLSRRASEQAMAISMMTDLTHESFAKRRKHLRETVDRFHPESWKGFDDSIDDFECRSFAYKYELIGLLVERGTLDYSLVRDFLQFSIVADWKVFKPLDTHLCERFGSRISEWHHFEKLADRIGRDLGHREEHPFQAPA